MRLFLCTWLVLTTLLATGCPVVVTCEDTGCRTAELCNLETGECEARARDCRTQNICRSSEVCDESTGECRPEQLRCTESFTCPEGQACNASSGFCERAALCESDADCAAAERCNIGTQACEPRTCVADVDCPSAYVCDDEGICSPGCRPNTGGCNVGEFCFVLTGDSVGSCVPNCRVDQDCPFGQICDLTNLESSRCVTEAPCTVDIECRTDEVCSDESCVQPPCASDDDCLAAQVCDVTTQSCRAADCEEDNFGNGSVPNHGRQTAFTLDLGSYTQLTLCPGRSDWFALDARGTDIIQVRLAQRSANDDFDLYVFDERGELLATNQQTGPISTVRLAAGRDRTLYIEVRSVAFAGGSYDLSLTREVCANDTFEENDSRTEATVVPSTRGVPSVLTLRACGFDEDWFRVRQTDPDLGLRIERVQSTADLRVEVFSPDGSQYVVRNDAPLFLRRVGATGSTFVRAIGALGQSGDYRLGFEILDPWECPGANQYSSATAALSIPPDAPTTETFCPADGAWEVDWLALSPPSDGMLDVSVRPTSEAPIEVALMRGPADSPSLVRTAVLDGEFHRIQAAIEASDAWFLRVSASATPGIIASEPAYEVTYSVVP